jgi:hypothetical protein
VVVGWKRPLQLHLLVGIHASSGFLSAIGRRHCARLPGFEQPREPLLIRGRAVPRGRRRLPWRAGRRDQRPAKVNPQAHRVEGHGETTRSSPCPGAGIEEETHTALVALGKDLLKTSPIAGFVLAPDDDRRSPRPQRRTARLPRPHPLAIDRLRATCIQGNEAQRAYPDGAASARLPGPAGSRRSGRLPP